MKITDRGETKEDGEHIGSYSIYDRCTDRIGKLEQKLFLSVNREIRREGSKKNTTRGVEVTIVFTGEGVVQPRREIIRIARSSPEFPPSFASLGSRRNCFKSVIHAYS